MKIALLTDGIYPYVVGGMQKHSYYLARYLAREKIQVVLYHTGPLEADTKNLAGFTDDELEFINSIFIPFPSVGRFPGHYVIESYQYSSLIFRSLVDQQAVDFVYVQGFSGWRTLQEKSLGKKLPPIGINFHGVEMFQIAPNLNVKLQNLLLRQPVKYNLNKADYVFSLGGKLTQLQKVITTKPIFEIPIGIEENWIVDEASRNVGVIRNFVFVGRYERRKGIEELQKVLEELGGNYDFQFYFIGPIPAEKQLKQHNVHYIGLLKEEQEVKRVLRAADVLVCPSYSEGMPTVILEAMASSLAIIATDTGAVRTMVSEANGWLITVASKQALKQALIAAINIDAQLLHQKKEASLRLVKERYTWEKVIQTTIDFVSQGNIN